MSLPVRKKQSNLSRGERALAIARGRNLTLGELKRHLHYDPETGKWTSLIGRLKVGRVHQSGYLRISVNGKIYSAGRLAHFYMTGKWPEETIDHRDQNKLNQRWDNLRQTTPTQQMINRTGRGNLRGVSKVNGRYVARIRYKGELIYLGTFNTSHEAHNAYTLKARKLHGDFYVD